MSTKNKRAKNEINKIAGHISFGEVLHSYRLSNDMTQVEFAKQLGISNQDQIFS